MVNECFCEPHGNVRADLTRRCDLRKSELAERSVCPAQWPGPLAGPAGTWLNRPEPAGARLNPPALGHEQAPVDR